ncbi:hypothetical protein BaRGS_00023156 [Batillaria attramentaria]|uniref:Uncharacterized protein n=1 Tax=Batillaria attramentaria TaxID=370345 RepID=A0ABD0KEQ0_9CAEN
MSAADVFSDDCLREKMMSDVIASNVSDAWGVSTYTALNSTIIRAAEPLDFFADCAKTFKSPADDFWTNYVLRLNEAEDFGALGGISLKNILTLALAWLLIFFCLMKGVKSSGKGRHHGSADQLRNFHLCRLRHLLPAGSHGLRDQPARRIRGQLSGSYNLMFVALCEIICLMYVYGYKNFCSDVEMMVGHKPNIYWLATWLVITPIAIAFIIIIGAIQYTRAYYGDYEFEDWAQGLGWIMVVLPLIAIVVVAIVQMLRYGVPGCFKPLPSWGPADDENRTGRYQPMFTSGLPYQIDTNGKGNGINGGYENAAYVKGQEAVQGNSTTPSTFKLEFAISCVNVNAYATETIELRGTSPLAPVTGLVTNTLSDANAGHWPTTFLFPYIIMLGVAGLPLFFIEMALGQFASEGPITVWKMSPFFTGIGFAMVIISGVVCIYYNVIIAYAIYYMWISFVNLDDDLPWANCQNWWRSEGCRDKPYPDFNTLNETEAMAAIKGDVYKDDCIRELMMNSSFRSKVNEMWGTTTYTDLNSTMIRSDLFKDCAKTFVSPADDFWTNYVLRVNEAEHFSNLGGISLKNILTLALAWILIFFCLMKGVKSSGKGRHCGSPDQLQYIHLCRLRYLLPAGTSRTWQVTFAMMETVISGISDMFPNALRRRKALFTGLTCLGGFLLGIPQTTKGGIWVLTLFDWYSGSYNLMFVALCELICLMYVYGYKNFSADIEMMVGFKPNIYWLATWLVITPIAIAFIIVIGAVQYAKAYYNGYQFEDWAQGIGWIMVVVPLLAIVIVAIVQMCRYGVPGCFKPLEDWGPAEDENRTGRYAPLNPSLPYRLDTVLGGKTGPTDGGMENAAFVNDKGKEIVNIRF